MHRRIVGKSLSVALLLMLAAWVIFKLFEVIFVFNQGWQPMPQSPAAITSVHQPARETQAARADLWLQQAQAELGAPALSAAIAIDGEVVWAGATGYADIDNRTEVTLDTLFRIGSSSKAVTALAMGVMIEHELIDLDAPVSRYLPDVAMPLASVSTRQAMSHTAGVREYGVCLCFPIWEYYNRKHFDSQRDALRPFEKSPLLFTPGEDFFYTSYGYNLTGAVIESITAISFSDFLTQRVLAPLSIQGVRVDSSRAASNDATFYELRDNSYKQAFYVDNTNKIPSGGIMATPSAMVKLGHQMIAPGIFSADTRDVLIAPQPLSNGQPNPQGYALGWRHTQAQLFDGALETPILHHHGVGYGAVSHFAVYLEYGMVVSVMMNKNQQAFGALPSRLAELFITPPAD